MKAAFLTGVRQVEIRDVPEPRPAGPNDVLLGIDTVGVCGSDMHYYRTGRIGQQIVKFPWIVGHECAATVIKVGSAVEDLRPGDRVAVDPLIPCGQCDQCQRGRRHTCRNQVFLGVPDQLPGSLAEQLVMPAACCYPIPDSMTMEQATLIEPFAIGLYTQRRAGTPNGEKIAILGCGPIGLCVLLAIKAAGPCRVWATDLLDNRLQLAAELGAEWTGNASRDDMAAAVGKLCPEGMDWVFECAGEQETLDEAVELLRPGGTLLIVGIPQHDRISFDMNHLRRKELTLLNIRRQNECVRPAIELVACGKVNVERLVTHHFTLSQTQRAFDIVADYKDGAVKAMIHVSSRP